MANPPVTDTIAHALAQLVDDSQSNGMWREPSHSDIDFQVNACTLASMDPRQQGQNTIGKAKRVRAILYTAMEDAPAAASKFVAGLLAKIRASGGFRPASPNYVGREAVENAKAAFASEGFTLGDDGSLAPKLLDALSGVELTDALRIYAARAQKGAEDAALVAGTGKDLMEATAAHALLTLNGSYPQGANFEGLLGMAFVALGITAAAMPVQPGESGVKAMERGLFTAAVGVNRLRNKQGTGHGRPWLPTVSDEEIKAAIEIVGAVSAYMLAKLARKARSR
ncbi:abortive infection family protein [Acidovorax sp. A79]